MRCGCRSCSRSRSPATPARSYFPTRCRWTSLRSRRCAFRTRRCSRCWSAAAPSPSHGTAGHAQAQRVVPGRDLECAHHPAQGACRRRARARVRHCVFITAASPRGSETSATLELRDTSLAKPLALSPADVRLARIRRGPCSRPPQLHRQHHLRDTSDGALQLTIEATSAQRRAASPSPTRGWAAVRGSGSSLAHTPHPSSRQRGTTRCAWTRSWPAR